jgi:hypothetical protein
MRQFYKTASLSGNPSSSYAIDLPPFFGPVDLLVKNVDQRQDSLRGRQSIFKRCDQLNSSVRMKRKSNDGRNAGELCGLT